MTLEEQIQFCKAKAENIKLRTEPETFIEITKSLEELNDIKNSNDLLQAGFHDGIDTLVRGIDH